MSSEMVRTDLVIEDDGLARCGWVGADPEYIRYHDEEWGQPLHGDRALFEKMSLEGFQAGLSWITILRKRHNFRAAFDGFDPEIVAGYDDSKHQELLQNAGIVRNRLKIAAATRNAQAFLQVQETFGSFDRYIWQFVGGKPRINRFGCKSDVPSETGQSDAMSKDLRGRGFKFVGSTICYAYMQAIGMVNDHLTRCYRHAEV